MTGLSPAARAEVPSPQTRTGSQPGLCALRSSCVVTPSDRVVGFTSEDIQSRCEALNLQLSRRKCFRASKLSAELGHARTLAHRAEAA